MDIRLSGAKNVRDFSEYGYKDYIRSAHLHRLTRGDIKLLREEYDLRTVIDLRTPGEVKEKPDMTIPGVTYLSIPVFKDAVPGISHEDRTDRLRSVIPDMPEMYRLMVTEEAYVRQLKKAMDIITDPARQGAVLWHCTEGKDRCGLVSAMFLLSRGIKPCEVMKDYLATNRVNSAKAKKLRFLVLLTGRGRDFAEKVSGAFLAKEEYLEPVMDKLIGLSAPYSEVRL